MTNVIRRVAFIFKRLIRNYALAAYYGADRRLSQFLPMAVRVARAKLKYRIGPFHFSLLGLAHVAEAEWSNYIIMGPRFDEARNALSPGAIRGVVDNKILFYEHCQRAGLPAIPIMCRIGGEPEDSGHGVEHVENAIRFKTLLQSSPPEIFIKPISGAHGDGIFRATRQDDELEFDGHRGNAVDLFTYLGQRSEGQAGFIIQPQIRPHAEMLPFASTHGLPTARVITAMGATGPQVLFACLRIPVGESITDNFGNGTSRNLVAAVDLRSGVLTHARGSRSRDWPVMVTLDAHPDTGHRITGSRLPFWEEILETVLRGQDSLPDLKTIGWDVAVTPDGVVLVELNSNYGVYSLQVAYQRGLKAELERSLNITIE